MVIKKKLKKLLCCCILFISCHNLKAQDTIIKVNINNFNGIAVKSGIDIILTQADEEKIEIKGLKIFAEDILTTKTDSGYLKFEMNKYTLKNFKWGKNQGLKIYISFKNLNNIQVSECATLLSDSVLDLDSLNITLDDGSDMKLNLKASSLNALINNGSNIYLYGNVTNFNLTGNNASNIKAISLIADNITAQLYNGTDAVLFATQNLSIIAKNGSDCFYKGTPYKKKFKTSNYSTVKNIK